MKTLNVKIAILLSFFTIASSVMAVVELAFSNWSFLIQTSPDIIVARCSRTPNPDRDRGSGPTGTLVFSDMEIVSILKGATNSGAISLETPSLGAARMSSTYFPRQGEYYLIFSTFYNHEYQAAENYRVVPLGLSFHTNSLSGQTLDEQIQTLLRYRLNNLNREIQKDEEEKARLEEGLQK